MARPAHSPRRRTVDPCSPTENLFSRATVLLRQSFFSKIVLLEEKGNRVFSDLSSICVVIKRIDELAERYIDCLVSRKEIERKEEMCGDRYRPKISKAGNDRHLKGSLIATSRHFRSLPFPLDFYSAFYSTASLYLPPTLFVIINGVKLVPIVSPLKFALPTHSNRIFEILQFC